MKNSTKKLKLIALAISIIFAGTSFAYASSKKPEYKEHNNSMDKSQSHHKNKMMCGENHHRRSHGMYGMYSMRGMLSHLDLSKTQMKEIKAIQEDKKSTSTMAEMRKMQVTKMESLLDNKTFNESKAKAIIEQREKNRDIIKLLNLKTRHAVYQILTKEQKKKLKEQMESCCCHCNKTLMHGKHQKKGHGAKHHG